MNPVVVSPGEDTALFVKNILLFEDLHAASITVLPFFADGYPGLLYHRTRGGLWVQPQNKQMPSAFLHGQTLHPIELHLNGPYQFIVFQLYPFVLNSFFNVDAAELNDSCYDLSQMVSWNECEAHLAVTSDMHEQVAYISCFLLQVFEAQKEKLDLKIREGIQLILDRKARITVKELCAELHLTVRTFERRFLKEVGIPAKDFIRITRFQQSLEQLYSGDFQKLTDIVYANGFADQSHFIKVFKAFTGKTPSLFLKR